MYVLSETQIYRNSMISLTLFKIKENLNRLQPSIIIIKTEQAQAEKKKPSLILSSRL